MTAITAEEFIRTGSVMLTRDGGREEREGREIPALAVEIGGGRGGGLFGFSNGVAGDK